MIWQNGSTCVFGLAIYIDTWSGGYFPIFSESVKCYFAHHCPVSIPQVSPQFSCSYSCQIYTGFERMTYNSGSSKISITEKLKNRGLETPDCCRRWADLTDGTFKFILLKVLVGIWFRISPMFFFYQSSGHYAKIYLRIQCDLFSSNPLTKLIQVTYI